MALIKCPKCGQTVLSVASVCPKCGHMLLQSPTPHGESGAFTPCRRCGKIVARTAATCEYCGYPQRWRRRLRRATLGVFGLAVLAAAVVGILRWNDGSARVPQIQPSPAPPMPAPPDTTSGGGLAVDSGAAADTLPPLADTIVVPPPVRPDTAMPESAPTPEPRRVTTSMLNRWTLTWTNLREGPGSEYAVVRVLRPGARVQVADVTRGWWAVYRDGALEGYVANSVLGDRPFPPDSVPGR